jgi:hypothetical protein
MSLGSVFDWFQAKPLIGFWAPVFDITAFVGILTAS